MIHFRLLLFCGLAYQCAQAEARCRFVPDTIPCALQLDLGPDIWICNEAIFTLNSGAPALPGVSYSWSGSSGLSCPDCPNPIVSGLGTGVYAYVLSMSDGACTVSDTLLVTVFDGQQPLYILVPDTAICQGQSVGLGGIAMPGTQYEWSDQHGNFLGNQPNPQVQPDVSTWYYVIAKNNSCPLQIKDSVAVWVFTPPVTAIGYDTVVCAGS